ncbi:putative GTP binding protein [Leptomonas seymouri]|uniref:Putative GTP binding protein n=1 Tax=Leptomonas seymouri TaxID=5684 RepID=A0A0N1PD45_LEPSE|nr:putative GTP binding protein [Leptomonas seymouri]|eukprot:KPI86541.1 putative GTP binding protein [Leptomonas seymouri]
MLRRCCLLWRRRAAGIVGLPNVGKSTLFNALTCSQLAKTGNFPFCTIDANTSKVPVVDPRLRRLAAFTGAGKIVDVEVDLTDVAGLIAGASKGAGLGNKFLNDIRTCTLILHTVRCFESAKEGFDTPHPIDDIHVVVNELVLSDLEAVERRLHRAQKTRRPHDEEYTFLKRLQQWLEDGKAAAEMPKTAKLSVTELRYLQTYDLLSNKPMMLVLNVDEHAVKEGNAFSREVEEAFGSQCTCRVSAAVEEQTAQLPSREERLMFLEEYGIDVPRGEVLMKQVYDLLKLQSFFTVGPKMTHGWTVTQGSTARQAAGEIHSDFEKNFLRAKVMTWNEFIQKPNLESAEMQMRTVSESYEMRDGDVMIVEHNTSRG